MKIAWIGTGIMGHAMVSNLAKSNHEIAVYNRSAHKTANLPSTIKICDSIARVVKEADVIFTMVGYPQDVLEIYSHPHGIFDHAKVNALCIDMTTSSPTLAKKLASLAHQYHVRILDAPVSGGDIGAKKGTLSIMVGGTESDFQEVKPLLTHLGTQITYVGEAGNGQHCKMVNQIVVAGNVAAICEGLYYAIQSGINPNTALQAISSGAASSWQVSNNGPKIIVQDYSPGFYIHHFVKDLQLVLEESIQFDIQLPIVEKVLELYQQLVQQGMSNCGTQALIAAYKKD